MSHFTRVKTQLVDRDLLVKALADLGYQAETGQCVVRGYEGRRTQAEVRVSTRHKGYDIGFARTGESFEMVADWWGIPSLRPERLLQQVQQRYAYHATRERLAAQGFAMADEQVDADGRIHLVLRRMG